MKQRGSSNQKISEESKELENLVKEYLELKDKGKKSQIPIPIGKNRRKLIRTRMAEIVGYSLK